MAIHGYCTIELDDDLSMLNESEK